MAGMFDDLIPAQQSGGGLFDDLIPSRTLRANASGSAGVEAPKSAWIDETMGQYTRDRAGIAKLHEEAKAAGVPLGRAVKWKRNQLERQDREGALQAPTTAPLSLGDANEGSVNERAAIIRAAEQIQSSPLATWPNTGSKTSIPGDGDDAELTSALDVLENYRKRVSPEVPGPQFMRQMFPRGTAQEVATDPNGSWGAAGESLLQGVRQSVAGGAQALGEKLRYAGNYAPAVRGLLDAPANALRTEGYEQGAASLDRMSELGAGLAQRPTGSVYDDPDGWARYLGQQGVAGSGPTLVGMGAGLVNPVLGAATFMGSAAGSEYGRARIEDNATPSEAGVRAVTAAATEGIPEAIGGAAMLGRLPLMKLAQSTARGRAAIAMPVEAGTEALTEKANIELERARGKYISPEEESRRIQDAAVIGGVMGGTIGAGTATAEGGASGLLNIRETIRQANSAADISSPMAAAFTRAAQEKTARILGPAATPDAAAGAQIADDAFRAAGVGTVAAADMAEQDALSRDLDAATRDQLGSEAEFDRLLTGTIGAGDGSVGDGLYSSGSAEVLRDTGAPTGQTFAGSVQDAQGSAYDGSQNPSAPVGMDAQNELSGRPDSEGNRDDQQRAFRTLPDGSIFLPGNPAEIRQRLTAAGSKWQGMAREMDGVQGVRFGRNAWPEVMGVVGGSGARTDVSSTESEGRGAIRPPVTGSALRDDLPAQGITLNGGNDRPGLARPSATVGGVSPAGVAQPTQAAVAVDGNAGGLLPSDGVVDAPANPTTGRAGVGAVDDVAADSGNQQSATPAPPALRDLTARRTNSDTRFDERVHDLTDFIALNGGLDRSALEAEGIDPANWNSRKARGQNDKFFGKPLFRKSGGMSLETLREKARDAGFRTDKDVLDLIGDSLGGRKTFTPAGSEYQMALADVARQEADAQARQQRMNALPPSVPETDADAYIASRETEFDAPADRDSTDLADIESTLASVVDTSPQQRASVVSLGHDYTAKLIELKRARAAGALNPDQQESYIDLLEQDRETGKVAGRPMVGIGNKSAYVDAQMQGKLMPVQVFLDADNFKALNDKFGHDVGDDAIRLIADVVRAEFGEGNVFHRGGDEFLTQGMTKEEVDAKMARVQSVLANYAVDLPLSDGRTATLEGIGVSYGTGANEKAADDSLKQDKQRRKEAGLRFDRREGGGVGRVGSGTDGARTDASGSDANPQDRSGAAAEGVGDGRQDRANPPDAGSPREVAGKRGDSERASDDAGRNGVDSSGAREGAAPAHLRGRDVADTTVPAGTVQSIRAAISQALGPKFLARLDRQPWFQIVDTVADLPPDVRKSITGEGVAGFVFGNRVFIIAEHAAQNPVGVTLHELGVHYGMTGILGEDFAPTLAKFKRLRAKDDRVGRAYERATEAADKDENGDLTEAAKATLDEEALAYFVEMNWQSPDTRGIVAKVIDAIKRLLNRWGIRMSWLNASPELLREVAIGAARMAADGRVSVGKDGGLVYARDLLGEAPSETAQLVAQWKAKVDAKLRGDGRAYVKPSEGPGDLFGGPVEETSDLFAKPQQRAQGVLFSRKRDNSLAAEDRALDRGNLEEAIRIGKRRIAEQREALGDISNGVILKMDGRDSWAIVMPDVEGGGKWRMQMFDRRGFVGHRTRNSRDAALDEALQDKYTTRDDGALDEIQDSPEFVRGNFIAGEMMQLNAGKITSAEFDKRIADYDSSVKVVAKYSRKADGGTITINGTERPTTDSTGKAIHPTEEGVRKFWEWFAGSKITDAKGRPIAVHHGTNATTFTPGTTKAGSASARAELERMAAAHGIKEWDSVAGIFNRWLDMGMADEQGVTKQVAEYARELHRQAKSSEESKSRVDLAFDAFNLPDGENELGSHFGTEPQATQRGTPFPFYLSITNPIRLPDLGTWNYQSVMRELRKRGVKISEAEYDAVFNARDNNAALRDLMLSKGIDGVVYENEAEGSGDSYIALKREQIKSADKNTGAFSPTDPRIAYSRKTEEPEGLPPPVAIESHLSNMLKLRAFFDSAVDVMARQPGLKSLADAVRSYFDNVRRRQGLVNEVLRAPVKAASKADLDAFERYQYALQNNLRDDVAEELAGMTDKGRALVSAWEKIAKLTNDENQKVGVQVFDPKIGGWRKIGTARNFFPRVLKPKFQEAMRQPHKYPTEWNRLVRILLDAGRIQSAEDAQEFLNTAFSNESAFEYFAGIEKARMEPLPRDLYDYSMDAAIGYKDAWADRLSQIEAFGQKIGQGDQAKDKFDEVLMTVTDDNTRNYVTRVRERITNTNSKSPFYKFMANMNTLVTGLMLGNPATAALNIVGGLSNNAMVFPLGPNLRALKELRNLGAGIRDAVAKGVLIDDYMGVSADAAAQGVSERLSNLTQGLLNWGGYNGTEYINRVHSMLVGKHFLSDSLTAINKNPRSRKSLLATAFLQRNGFDVDTLAAESTKPADERPETNKFLRFASNLTQGSYKIDQTPIFVDEPIGKFLFKYQKFGTQINRVFYQQMLRPFVQSVFKGGEPVTLKNADGTEAQERVRNFVPLVRFIVGAIPGGMLVQFIREAFFGYGEDGPDEDEIRRKLADGETAAAAAMLAERAFIAITALGAGGFLGNYMQTAKDFQERQRYKNPLDPPGLAPVKSFVALMTKGWDQQQITLADLEQEIQNNVSLYRTGKRLLSSGINMVNDESVTFAAREAARREHNHVRYMARRYADSVGIEAKRRAPSEIAATANTPTNRAIKDALLLGDGETARALAAEYVASFDNAYDAANALASIRNSIRLGQPALVQLAPSETERRRFMRWAFSNLTPEGYARIKDTDEKYRKAAASSGLWKPESDAAAMKRDRKADESKAQWSDSQRNSFLRSKGLKR